jgi:hypothetical protein
LGTLLNTLPANLAVSLSSPLPICLDYAAWHRSRLFRAPLANLTARASDAFPLACRVAFRWHSGSKMLATAQCSKTFGLALLSGVLFMPAPFCRRRSSAGPRNMIHQAQACLRGSDAAASRRREVPLEAKATDAPHAPLEPRQCPAGIILVSALREQAQA